jgi:isopenicillin-N epimerase
MPVGLGSHFTLDPAVTFVNHGSFGACPRVVQEAQSDLRARLEAEPVRFFVRELPALLDEAREELAAFLAADPADVAFVPNATTGVNAVLRSLAFAAGDELLVTDHAYNACRNALDWVAARSGARVVVARVPFAGISPRAALDALMAVVTPRTRLALLDHVTSPTGVVMPLAALVDALAARGVDALVDGAHAPGMVPVDLRALGAAYYTGNCHKWLCAPKGAAFVHVRRDRQDGLVPTTISHGANMPTAQRSRFRLLFDWTGTADPTAYLSVPVALRFMGGLLPGGWPEVMAHNHALALEARDLLCAALAVPAPVPDEMLGSLAAVPLPDAPADAPPLASPLYADPLQDRLFAAGFEVPVVPWPAPPRRLLRISAQVYNGIGDYQRLAEAVTRVGAKAS